MKSEVKFRPVEFESRWQKIWQKERIYQPDLINAKRPFYNLMMFPYPSAEGLHVGNMYAFTGADIYGRFKRMQGFDVFEPIGLDGFGIHSENYAIKIGKHPAEQAKISQENFYRQLHAIGNGFAWENTLETYDPDYYKWTQWIFIQMFKNGLAYRKKSPVNFCPSCKTVLSDEQVINKSQKSKVKSQNGKEKEIEVAIGACERCGTRVEKREMEQWYFKITKYAERLQQNTYRKDFQWTEKVKVGQRNWIGKKTGISIKYQVLGIKNEIECFTTRPDTNFGATFVVIGPEHEFVASLLKSKIKNQKSKLDEIENYVNKTKSKSETERIAEGREKTGVFTGFYCINQLTNYKMPLFISDFVLGNVGTGAVVGVPGHDLRDFQFAKKFKIPIIRVVIGKDGDESEITREGQVQEEEGTMINSGFLDGMDIHKAAEKIMDYMEEKGWGKRITTYKLRDWCISRQRYWGAPIPMVFCQDCAESGLGWLSLRGKDEKYMPGWYPVPEEELPVLLPEDVQDWKPEGTGKGPLAKIESFVKVDCPECGGSAQRETDVCDTFLDSSWYHLRYPSVGYQKSKIPASPAGRKNQNDKLPWNPQITKKWLPVTQYIGGAEHTVLHLLYARFVAMVFHDLSFIDFDEPYSRFYAHGLIIAEGAKMSKSRGNVIIPDEYINKYGADTLRAYLMFLGPFDMGGDFRDTGIAGMYRFLNRVWRLVQENQKSNIKNQKSDEKLLRIMNKTIREVTQDLENFRYNTAIAHIMEYVNYLTDNLQLITNNSQLAKEAVKNLLLLLAPFAPHMTEELFQLFKIKNQKSKIKSDKENFESVHLHQWPTYNPKYLVEEEVTIVVQVNGKTRNTIKIKNQKSKIKTEVEKSAQNDSKIRKYLEGKTINKVIFVPGRLINFVV